MSADVDLVSEEEIGKAESTSRWVTAPHDLSFRIFPGCRINSCGTASVKEGKAGRPGRCFWHSHAGRPSARAFCVARHQATTRCRCLGQEPSAGEARTFVMKWAHSILQEPTFCTEWQAQTTALRLSFDCGTIGANTSRSEHRQLRMNRSVPYHASFTDDVTVLCTDSSRFTLTHCRHGFVQRSICLLQDQLYYDSNLDAAPLSSFNS